MSVYRPDPELRANELRRLLQVSASHSRSCIVNLAHLPEFRKYYISLVLVTSVNNFLNEALSKALTNVYHKKEYQTAIEV